jgi:hypothetical protein
MVTIWHQIEYLKYEIQIAQRYHWTNSIEKYQKRLAQAENAALGSSAFRCSSVWTDPDTKITHRCTLADGHKQGQLSPKRIKHVSLSCQWTDEGVKRHELDLQKKALKEAKKQAKILKIIPITPTIPQLTDSIPVTKKSSRTLKQQRGDEQEAEIYQRLIRIYPQTVMTNINAMGVDIQCKPDIDVQSKAFKCVGPKDVSHFADSSNAPLKMLVAMSFSKRAKVRAAARNVTLLTMKEFRDRYQLPQEAK